jgi:hypothetical protein
MDIGGAPPASRQVLQNSALHRGSRNVAATIAAGSSLHLARQWIEGSERKVKQGYLKPPKKSTG